MLIPMIALRGMTVFPGMMLHFDIGREKSVKALEEALQTHQNVFLVAQRDARVGNPGLEDLCAVGTVAQIRQLIRMPGDTVRALVEGSARARLISVDRQEPYMSAHVEVLHPPENTRASAKRVEALIRAVREAFENYAGLTPRMSPETLMNVMVSNDLSYLADYIAQSTPIPFEGKQAVLEEHNPLRRLEKVLSILTRETEILRVESDLQSKVRETIAKDQRDYFLREQMKTIREELGEDGEQGETEAYAERVRALRLPEETEERLLREVRRLGRQSPHSPEYALIRTYLDTVLELPWNTLTRDRLDVSAAKRILDRDHYGLEKVKERVLEFLAVKRLAPELKGQILCLVGPPGVGKTSVALSVAGAMKRRHARLSLGGVRDEADIRGHRKTYIGAMPGRIVNALRLAGSRNAMILLDEIDKLSSDFRGDPSAALLEVLDPEQNAAFRDHYLEVPFDLSGVLFITTANTTDTIPRALLDRMEVIEITSYTDEEKLHIAKRHLIPRQLKRHGLTRAQLRLSDATVRELIAGYTREAGVRNLERELAALCRKTAKAIAEGPPDAAPRTPLAPSDLEALLGTRRFKPERRRGEDEVGVASGLAWTRTGGELLEVEAGVVDGTGKVELTGNLGDIMKESARAALTYIRSRTGALDIDPEFHKNSDIHIHFPEGAIPKDGPSAGITMAVAMVSALCGAPVYRNMAMTGEISLRGRVLPVGGLKEKTMAAYRAGIKTVIIPADNESNLRDVDPAVRGALNFILADHMDTVLSSTIDLSRRTVRQARRGTRKPEEDPSPAPLLPLPPQGGPFPSPGFPS
ncbi:MAG: endopeptidase La [Oscillospiraceae bacterium]|nr:endopeptidase La [Oscillospiraceae bacterium]